METLNKAFLKKYVTPLKLFRLSYWGYGGLSYYLLRNSVIQFIVIDSFLAYLAIEIGLFYLKTNKKLFFLLWLLFFPNNTYLYTDIIHVSRLSFYPTNSLIMTLNPTTWLCFFWMLLGIFLLIYVGNLLIRQISDCLKRNYELNHQKCFLVNGLFLLLFSFGTYIGRFLRFNTIDLFSKPLTVLSKIFYSLNIDACLFIASMTIFQLIIFFFLTHEHKSFMHRSNQ
ncbi:DUF1361 domain-containing protein [Enterococcus hermanniensis]|uniref:DUF1361 domain-containing protein n=1 Tax=Enterococcus hermanniensis TaxID=249189 RepID=UPI003CCBAA43